MTGSCPEMASCPFTGQSDWLGWSLKFGWVGSLKCLNCDSPRLCGEKPRPGTWGLGTCAWGLMAVSGVRAQQRASLVFGQEGPREECVFPIE